MSILQTAVRSLAVVFAIAGGGAPAAQAGVTPLASELSAGRVAAWDGTIAWSRVDPATGKYRLVVSRDGGTPVVMTTVAASSVPFDIDLGTNDGGSTYGVYSRCAHPKSRKGCDLWRIAMASGVTRKLTRLSSPTRDETQPATYDGKVAFISRERSGGVTRDVLRLGDESHGAKAARTLASVRVGKYSSMTDVDLGPKQATYVALGLDRYEFGSQTVHIVGLASHRDQAIYAANSGGANFAQVTRPTLTDDLKAFVWARTNNGSGTGNRVVRYTLRTSKLTYAQGSPRWADSSWAGGTLGLAVMTDGSGTGTCFENINDGPEKTQCSVGYTGPLSFVLKP